MSWKKIGQKLGNVLGGKPGTSGPQNPWSPNQVNDALIGLQNTGQYDFLKTGPELTDKATLASSLYKPTTGKADAAFSDFLGKLEGPSSVDAMRSEIEGQKMQALLEQIDLDTAGAAGKVRTAALDSGWGGAGMGSDIESVGLGRAYGEGARAQAEARTNYATSELDRQAQREKALAEAMGLRYTTTAAGDTQDKSIAASMASSDASSLNSLLSTEASLGNDRDLSLADILSGNARISAATLANLFNSGAEREIAGRKPGTTGLFSTFFNNFAQSAGQKSGENAAGPSLGDVMKAFSAAAAA